MVKDEMKKGENVHSSINEKFGILKYDSDASFFVICWTVPFLNSKSKMNKKNDDKFNK